MTCGLMMFSSFVIAIVFYLTFLLRSHSRIVGFGILIEDFHSVCVGHFEQRFFRDGIAALTVRKFVFNDFLLSGTFKLIRELRFQTGELVIHALDLSVFVKCQLFRLVLLAQLESQIVRIDRLCITKRKLNGIFKLRLFQLCLKLLHLRFIAGDLTLKLFIAFRAFLQLGNQAVGRVKLGGLAVKLCLKRVIFALADILTAAKIGKLDLLVLIRFAAVVGVDRRFKLLEKLFAQNLFQKFHVFILPLSMFFSAVSPQTSACLSVRRKDDLERFKRRVQDYEKSSRSEFPNNCFNLFFRSADQGFPSIFSDLAVRKNLRRRLERPYSAFGFLAEAAVNVHGHSAQDQKRLQSLYRKPRMPSFQQGKRCVAGFGCAACGRFCGFSGSAGKLQRLPCVDKLGSQSVQRFYFFPARPVSELICRDAPKGIPGLDGVGFCAAGFLDSRRSGIPCACIAQNVCPREISITALQELAPGLISRFTACDAAFFIAGRFDFIAVAAIHSGMVCYVQKHITADKAAASGKVDFACDIFKAAAFENRKHVAGICCAVALDRHTSVFPRLNYSGRTVIISVFSPSVTLVVTVGGIVRPRFHLRYRLFNYAHSASVPSSSSGHSSGIPAREVSRDSTPASREALPTMSQFTSDSTADVPMVATAVCATVFSARMPAALIQFFQHLFIVFPPFII
nr:MAG TPA: hypothetical protein [Caudoviricetes sp.]